MVDNDSLETIKAKKSRSRDTRTRNAVGRWEESGKAKCQNRNTGTKRPNKQDRTVPFIRKVHAATIPTSKTRVGSVPSSRHLPGLVAIHSKETPRTVDIRSVHHTMGILMRYFIFVQ